MSDIEGDMMPFETSDPKWTTIKLENGVVLQIKLEVTGVVFRGYTNPNGSPSNLPLYEVFTNNSIRTQNVPRELMKKNIVSKKIDDNSSYR